MERNILARHLYHIVSSGKVLIIRREFIVHRVRPLFNNVHHQGLNFVLLTRITRNLNIFQRERLIQLLLLPPSHVLVTIGICDSAYAYFILRVSSFEQALADIEAKVVDRSNLTIAFFATLVTILDCLYLFLPIYGQLINNSLIYL